MLPVQYVFHFSNKMYQKSLQKRLREFKQAEDHYAIYRYNCAESDLETISKEVAAVYPLINHLYRFKPQEKIQFAVYARKADLQNIIECASVAALTALFREKHCLVQCDLI